MQAKLLDIKGVINRKVDEAKFRIEQQDRSIAKYKEWAASRISDISN
jgi:hypothetical protein